ncbi:MAG: hypothetical protein K2H38_06620 [Muribaculaceae bacterium]|nr:hypothetical protein [Muribaculaceae bacterium]
MKLKSLLSIAGVVLFFVGAIVSCGPSKAEREEAARQDSIRIADAVARALEEARKSPIEASTPETTPSDIEVKPLTQYYFVKALDRDMGVKFRDNIAVQLKNLGFEVKTFKRPSHLDEMESYLSLKATRQGTDGVTKIEMQSGGEDPVCTIDFANQAEADDFVQSMIVSNYQKDGNIYSHPANGMAKIFVKVSGKRIKMISPFEMLPSDF